MYSPHTSVMSDKGSVFEVQIRTHECTVSRRKGLPSLEYKEEGGKATRRGRESTARGRADQTRANRHA